MAADGKWDLTRV